MTSSPRNHTHWLSFTLLEQPLHTPHSLQPFHPRKQHGLIRSQRTSDATMGRYLLHILTAVLFSCATGVVHAHQPPSAPRFNPFLPANITNHTVPTLHPFNQTFRANITDLTFKYPVAAPYFRNVTAGAAWVMPSSRFDLGARGFDCECFDPSRKFHFFHYLRWHQPLNQMTP